MIYQYIFKKKKKKKKKYKVLHIRTALHRLKSVCCPGCVCVQNVIT